MKTNIIKFKRYIKNDPFLKKEILFYSSGAKSWFLNGKLHREDGPACEWGDGSKCWWLNGERHREDGPAHIGRDGTKEWWLNGKYYNRKEFPEALGKYKKKTK